MKIQISNTIKARIPKDEIVAGRNGPGGQVTNLTLQKTDFPVKEVGDWEGDFAAKTID